MSTRQRLLCLVYALVSLAALVCTWGQALPYLSHGFLDGNLRFWQDTLANGASRFITVDIMFVFAVVWHWMLLESRRLKLRGSHWYLLGSVLIAFSAVLPLFMIHREMALSRMAPSEHKALGGSGAISVVILLVVALAYSGRAFLGTH